MTSRRAASFGLLLLAACGHRKTLEASASAPSERTQALELAPVLKHDGPPIVLSTSRAARLPIVVSPKASALTLDATKDLKSYLDRMSGASFNLDSKLDATAKGIVVGSVADFPALAGEFASDPAGDVDPSSREAFVVRSDGPDRVLLVAKTDLGVSRAVTRFLEELGCRWFFEGPRWEIIPTAPAGNLIYSSAAIHDRPVMVYRVFASGGFHDPLDEAGNRRAGEDALVWRKRNYAAYPFGGRLDSALTLDFGQKWALVMKDIQADHPHWFTDCPDGCRPPHNRYGWLAGQQTTTLELGNPAVREMYWQWAANRWAKNYDPNGDSVPLEPSDGTNAISRSPAVAQLSDSDQIMTLANELATRLSSSKDPALRRRYVSLLAGYYHAVPPKQPVARNVYVAVQNQVATIGSYTSLSSLIDAWRAAGAQVGIRDNFSYAERSLLGSHYSQNLSGSSSDYPSDSVALANDFKMYGSHGVTAAVLERLDNFGYHGLGYYLSARLMWNPYADVEALRTDFFVSAFGPAATEMRGYFDLLDPKGSPQLVSRATMAQAYRFLVQAAVRVAGNRAILDRINDLKCYLHHNALWWQIARAPHNTSAQIQLLKSVLNWDYRIRQSYMVEWHEDLTGVLASAAAQFGASPEWQSTNGNASWRSPNNYPSDREIEQAVTADQAYFGSDAPTQVDFSGPIVGVAFPGSSQEVGYFVGDKPQSFALYTAAGSDSLSMSLNVGAFNAPERPASATTITLSDAVDGHSAGSRSVEGESGNKLWQPVTFGDLRAQHGFFAELNNFGSQTYLKVPAGSAFAIRLDKKARPALGLYCPPEGLYFYVPKGTKRIEYYWNPRQTVSSEAPIAAQITAHQLLDGDNAAVAPDGTVCKSESRSPRCDITDYQGLTSVPVPPGQDGRVWRITNLSARQLWFYNVPPYLSVSPANMILPKRIADADGLTAR